ncbi:TonB-dependent siderophore receptor, partial [Rhodopseudomonas sp. B29]|uniref:TonB-dependent siderophore receptor n=1 Tax=Rhodopseudomonas sp. B29 TaxID=95607 RepID=UPI0004CEBA79
QFRQNLRYTNVANDLTGVRSEGLQSDNQTLNRSENYVVSSSRNFALDNQVQADFLTGPFAHKMLFGVDYLKTKSDSDYRFAMISPINIFNPVYGSAIPSASSLSPFIKVASDQEQVGTYMQDQIKFDRFTVSLTGRHDWADATTVSTGSYPAAGTYPQRDQANTGRVGLNYLFDFGLAPYISYTTSFQPITGTDRLGNAFKPTTGDGSEVGLKYNPTGTTLLLTAALFEINQKNVLTADPANVFFSVQTGAARVRGFEFEARGNVTRELQIVGGYSHFDPRVTAANDGTVGKYLTNTAKDQASLWAKYTWFSGPIAGLGLGAGVRYVGETYGDAANTLRIPSYTLFDAAISYDFAYLRPEMKGWTAQINAKNITDRYYVASCVTSTAYCGLGSARTVLGTL